MTKKNKHFGSSIDDLMKMTWKPFKTAPKDGTLVIFWISSQKGFEDITANFYYHSRKWWWECDDSPLKRPDLVNGWMIYPQPPNKVLNADTLEAFKEAKKPKRQDRSATRRNVSRVKHTARRSSPTNARNSAAPHSIAKP